jgi:hypothetical protein
MFKHQLGARVRDRVTGLEGVIVARVEWLYGCRRYTVQPAGVKDGKPFDTIGFDEDALDVLSPGIEGTVRDSGGPTAEPSQPRIPERSA